MTAVHFGSALLVLSLSASWVEGRSLGPECKAYLARKKFPSPEVLKEHLQQCTPNDANRVEYGPNPLPNIPGATDTTPLSCRYGNPDMRGGSESTCCGGRPHFNWIVATCEPNPAVPHGNFCRNLPAGVGKDGVKINYVASYQFDGEQFVLVDESTVGDLSPEGVAGSFAQGSGWESKKSSFGWKGGDWPTKYAPWGKGSEGPRGLTPPALMWVLSAENFYYGAFYMLSQLNLNLEGLGNPTGTNCWNWEIDPVEGAIGWLPPGHETPGNLNQLYSTNNAAVSGCMPIPYTAAQANGNRREFTQPPEFRDFCEKNPTDAGCQPWEENVMWSGGVHGTQRFENLADKAYVFAVVLDHQGIWIYRWIPDAAGKTGWPGVERTSAARTLQKRPNAVKDPRGLRSNVKGDVPEAVILQPSVPPEAACLRAEPEWVNWQFGSNALAAMAAELGESGPGGRFEGAQNWWSNFHNTEQYQGYPMSIAGVPTASVNDVYDCNKPGSFGASCRMRGDRRLLARNRTAASSPSTWV